MLRSTCLSQKDHVTIEARGQGQPECTGIHRFCHVSFADDAVNDVKQQFRGAYSGSWTWLEADTGHGQRRLIVRNVPADK